MYRQPIKYRTGNFVGGLPLLRQQNYFTKFDGVMHSILSKDQK